MELEDNHHLRLDTCKRSSDENSRQTTKMSRTEIAENCVEGKTTAIGSRIASWQHRIYRVSKASGSKDRHSKVFTAKGLRDRRVRLSVPTAIQFYDLQDRLGYDQPSKAIEWLIKAAEASINELPSLDFMQHLSVEHQMIAELETKPSCNLEQNQYLSSKSRCSSTSDTSKGSVLSLSQSESRVEAQDYIQEPKVTGSDDGLQFHGVSVASNLSSHTSFTELLTGRRGNNGVTTMATVSGADSSPGGIQKQISTADYFGRAEMFLQSQKSDDHQQLASVFSSHPFFGSCNNSTVAMMPFNISSGDNSELQKFSTQDNIMPLSVASQATAGDYSYLSFASGLAGFNRGTLQSNSSSHFSHYHQHNHSHIQNLSSVDGANLPLFFGAAVASAAPAAVDHQFPSGFDGRLQLCHGDGFRHPDLKDKRKS